MRLTLPETPLPLPRAGEEVPRGREIAGPGGPSRDGEVTCACRLACAQMVYNLVYRLDKVPGEEPWNGIWNGIPGTKDKWDAHYPPLVLLVLRDQCYCYSQNYLQDAVLLNQDSLRQHFV